MTQDFMIRNADEIQKIASHMHDHFDCSSKQLKVVIAEFSGTGKWGMARLWRSWMAYTAKYMAHNGAKMPLIIGQNGEFYGSRPFNADDAHELFTRQWLKEDEQGNRLSWKKSEGENVADKGQRFLAMLKHQQWCIEKGINLPMPHDSEFSKLKDKTEA